MERPLYMKAFELCKKEMGKKKEKKNTQLGPNGGLAKVLESMFFHN